MTRKVALLAAVVRDLEEAFDWYESRRRGLGLEFLLAFDAGVARLRRAPEASPRLASSTRKLVLRRFPFVVLYALEPDRVLITGVFHVRRDPGRWPSRVRERAAVSVAPIG